LNNTNNPRAATEQGDIFFQTLLELWNDAANAGENPVTTDLELCGFHLRLKFASQMLFSQLTQAFRHCPKPSPGSRPDFTIHAYAGSPAQLIRKSPWQRDDLEQPRGEIRPVLGTGIIASLVGTDLINVYHRHRKQAVYCVRDDTPVPYHELAAPFRPLLHWWLREQNWFLVHGAGLGYDGKNGVLLMGKSGSGKSTLAVAAALDGGLDFCGDDYCAIRITEPYQLAPVFPCAKLTEETRLMLGLKKSGLFIERSRKHLCFPGQTLTARIPPKNLDLAALVLPTRETGSTESSLRRLSPAQTAIQLAVSSLYQLPHAGETEFNGLAAMARKLPGWSLAVPDNKPLEAVSTLKSILKQSKNSGHTTRQ
jgi:hypothetical protein